MTTTQIRPASTRVIATASVNGTTTISDSANGFTAADIGKTVTTANVTAGTTISAVAGNGASATLSAAATGTSGPQSCTIGTAYASITRDTANRVAKSTLSGFGLTNGQQDLALMAAGSYDAAGGAGDVSTIAAATLAAVGLSVVTA